VVSRAAEALGIERTRLAKLKLALKRGDAGDSDVHEIVEKQECETLRESSAGSIF